MTDSLLGVLAFAFAVSITAAASPGPVSAAVITEASRLGWRVGPWISVGHSLLELVVVILLGLGLASGMASPPIQRGIAAVGGLVLLVLGANYLAGAARGTMLLPQASSTGGERSDPARASGLRLAGLGVLTTASNPFWYAWWVTVAAGYLAQAQALGQSAVAAFYIGHISADFTWNTLIATATSAGRRWLTEGRYRVLIAAMGLFMAYFGVRFLMIVGR